MIEVSTMEMALLVLNMIGWGAAFYYKDQQDSARRFISALLENDELRDKIVRDLRELKARAERSS